MSEDLTTISNEDIIVLYNEVNEYIKFLEDEIANVDIDGDSK